MGMLPSFCLPPARNGSRGQARRGAPRNPGWVRGWGGGGVEMRGVGRARSAEGEPPPSSWGDTLPGARRRWRPAGLLTRRYKSHTGTEAASCSLRPPPPLRRGNQGSAPSRGNGGVLRRLPSAVTRRGVGGRGGTERERASGCGRRGAGRQRRWGAPLPLPVRGRLGRGAGFAERAGGRAARPTPPPHTHTLPAASSPALRAPLTPSGVAARPRRRNVGGGLRPPPGAPVPGAAVRYRSGEGPGAASRGARRGGCGSGSRRWPLDGAGGGEGETGGRGGLRVGRAEAALRASLKKN